MKSLDQESFFLPFPLSFGFFWKFAVTMITELLTFFFQKSCLIKMVYSNNDYHSSQISRVRQE